MIVNLGIAVVNGVLGLLNAWMFLALGHRWWNVVAAGFCIGTAAAYVNGMAKRTI